jgi:hypothetical protein
MNLFWEEEDTCSILTLMNLIPNILELQDLFNVGKKASNKLYLFKGAAFFWGAHYYDYIRVAKPEGDAWVQVNDTFM